MLGGRWAWSWALTMGLAMQEPATMVALPRGRRRIKRMHEGAVQE